MQKILITGANGFTGYYLSNLLLQKGYKVFATGKGACRLPHKQQNFFYWNMDFTNPGDINSCLNELLPHVIVHGGAFSKPDFCEQHKELAFATNVTGTKYLLEAAASLQSHFIFLSTDFVFSGQKPGFDINEPGSFYIETDERNPVNFYGETKCIAEDEVIKYPFNNAVVRTATVFGNNYSERDNLVTTVASSLKSGKSYSVFSDQVRSPTYIEDLCEGILKIIENKAGGTYHIAGAEVCNLYELALKVSDHLQIDKKLLKEITAATFKQSAARPYNTCLDINKARHDLGYQPRSLKEGLRKTLEQDEIIS